MTLTIQPARPTDAPDISSLLDANHLCLDGVSERIDTTLIALDGNRLVGTAALELFPDGALLRSVAVVPELRGSHIGHDLVTGVLSLAAERSIGDVYLLTTTAERYFPRFGFERITREVVPEGVRQSAEFVSGCPTTAVVMRAPVATRLA